VVSLTKEKPATVIRQALRAGLPVVANSISGTAAGRLLYRGLCQSRPERLKLEAAMAKQKVKLTDEASSVRGLESPAARI